MTPKPPAPNPLTSNWDLEDEGVGATREVEPDELFVRAGLLPGRRGAPDPGGAETAPSSSDAVTIRPAMPPEEYVDRMMRLAPPSEGGLLALGPELGDGFSALTPWSATAGASIDQDPPSISSLFEPEPETAGRRRFVGPDEDLGAAGTGSYSEVDFSELIPEIMPRKRLSTMPPRIAGDELDQLLSDEALRAVLPREEEPLETASRRKSRALELDLEFDDPSLMLPGPEPREAAPDLDLAAINPRTIDLDELTATELPDFEALAADPDAEGIEPGPDTMVDGSPLPKEVPPPPPAEGTLQSRLEKLRARFEVGDYSGALIVAEGMLDEAPRHLAARCYADACRAMLRQMYQARIGDKARIVRVVMTPDQIRGLSLDHRTGFVLSCIDGMSTIDDILDVSGMQPLDTMRMLYDLVQQGVIEVEPAPGRS